jgi:CHASE3 domain sensor protein
VNPPEFNRTLRQLVTLPILLLVLMAGFLVWQIAAATVAQRALDHSDEVTAQLQELQNRFIDEETGLRGFQLTGDPVMLDPWKAAAGPIESHFAMLRRMLAGDTAQSRALDDLEIRYNQWLGFANAVLHRTRRR